MRLNNGSGLEKQLTLQERKMMTKNEDLLCGWQEIADYMDKSIRTAQRWSRLKGLPVKYPAGHCSTPHISKKEMERWMFDRGASEMTPASAAHENNAAAQIS
jgi:hypothetical protein